MMNDPALQVADIASFRRVAPPGVSWCEFDSFEMVGKVTTESSSKAPIRRISSVDPGLKPATARRADSESGLTFTDPEKIRELARKGENWGDSESRQMLEYAIETEPRWGLLEAHVRPVGEAEALNSHRALRQ